MTIRIICNPISGGGRGRKTAEAVQKALWDKGIAFETLMTSGPEHAFALAREGRARGADRLIVIGGDGTLSEAAGGAVECGLPMGVIPAGTGNDFVKTVGIPIEAMAALDVCLENAPRPTDVMRLNDRLVLNEAGTGFDVMVLDYAQKAKRYVKGLLPYLYGVLQTIFHYKSVCLTLQAEDEPPVTREVLVVAAGNGRFIGGGIPIAPEADPGDGLMDFVLVNKMSKPRMLSVLPGLLKGKILSFPETEFRRVRKLTIESPGMRMNIDGEVLPMDRVCIETLPGALMLFRP